MFDSRQWQLKQLKYLNDEEGNMASKAFFRADLAPLLYVKGTISEAGTGMLRNACPENLYLCKQSTLPLDTYVVLSEGFESLNFGLCHLK